MERSDVHKAKGPKEELQEFLEKNPPIYTDAVKWTLACYSGIRFSSLFDDLDSKVDSETFLRELQESGFGGFVRIVNDPKAGSEAMVHLTEKGRDAIIDLFYSGKEKRELKRLVKIMDHQPK